MRKLENTVDKIVKYGVPGLREFLGLAFALLCVISFFAVIEGLENKKKIDAVFQGVNK